MSDRDIMTAARQAEDTGDFSEIERMSEMFLKSAERQWAPHEIQGQKYRDYHAKPWWKKLFLREPFGGAMIGRCEAADNLMFAQSLRSAVEKREVKSFTNRR